MVEKILIKSLKNGVNLTINILETKPLDFGLRIYNSLINFTDNLLLVPDICLSSIIEKVDFVLLGAQIITENGGIIGYIGSYTVSVCAKYA